MHSKLFAQLTQLGINPDQLPQEYQQLVQAVDQTYFEYDQEKKIQEQNIERSEDEFFSITSHQLHTPLTAIRGNSSIILTFYKDKLLDPELVTMLTDINKSGVRMVEIVNDFLNVFQLEQGKMNFKAEGFDIRNIVNQVIDEIKPTNNQPEIQIIFNCPDQPIGVQADPYKTKEVVKHLITNALKFTEKGQITVNLTQENGMVKFSVQDTGKGIEPVQQSVLFQKFQPHDGDLLTRDTSKGTGLGLYISRLMVEGMGGKIWLEKSEPNVGSVFVVGLPLT